MAQFQYGFIVKAPGYKLGEKDVALESEAFKSNIIGVGSLDEACEAAKQLVTKGVTLIELCSGFKADDAKSIFEAIEGSARVGYIGEILVKQ
ncbi:MAG: alanine racemase [Desulforhopalus sp.]|jgi:alanine racemase